MDAAELLAFWEAEEADVLANPDFEEYAVVVWLFPAVVFRPPCAFEPAG